MIVSPVRGEYRISQGFGKNKQVYSQFGMLGHNGQDIALPVGTSLFAPIDGIVEVNDAGSNAYGLSVRITEEFGTEKRQVILAHLSETNLQTGQKILAGQEIGKSGNTGFSTGPHLHWGLRRILSNGNVKDYDNGYFGWENIFEQGWITKNEPSIY